MPTHYDRIRTPRAGRRSLLASRTPQRILGALPFLLRNACVLAAVAALAICAAIVAAGVPARAGGAIPPCGAIVVNVGQNLYTMNTSTGSLTQFGGTNPLGFSTTAIGQDPQTTNIWYASSDGSQLGMYDGTTSYAFATGLSGLTVNRMAFNASGVGYFTDSPSAKLYSFIPNGTSAPTITLVGTLTATSGPALGTLTSGDFAFDYSGRMYGVFTAGTTKKLYLIDTVALTATPILDLGAGTTGTVASLAFSSTGANTGLGYFVDQGTGDSFSVDVGNGTITNLGSTAPGPTGVNDAASCVMPNLQPNLGAVLSVAPTGTQTPTTQLTYTVTLTNSGSAATYGTQLTLPIPANTTYVPGSTTLNGAAIADSGGAMPFAAGAAIHDAGGQAGIILTQPASGSNAAVVTFSVTVGDPYATTAAVTETASFSYSGAPGSSSTVSGSSNTVSTPISPYLGLAKTHSGTFTAGANGAYTITATNLGGATTSAPVTVSDALPTGLTVGSGFAAPAGWTCSATPGATNWSCTSSGGTTLAPAAAVAFTLPVAVAASAPVGTNAITNTASAYGGGDPAHATAGTAVAAADPTTVVAVPDLTVTTTDNAASFGGAWTIGQSGAQFTVALANTGGAPTSGTVTFSDPLPAGMTVGAGFTAPAGWTCNAPPGATLVTCTSNGGTALAASGGLVDFTIPVVVGSTTALGPNTDTASAYGGSDPVHPAAGSAASGPDTVSVRATPSLTNVATSGGTVTPGSVTTDTFTLTNTSGQPGTFAVAAAPAIAGPGGTLSASAFLIDGTLVAHLGSNTPLQDLQAALSALPPSAAGAAIDVGVRFTIPAGSGTGTVTDTLSATVAAAGVTSAPALAVATTTVASSPTLTNVPASAAQTVAAGSAVVDTFTLTNTTSQTGTFAVTSATVTGSGAGPIGSYVVTAGGHTTTYPTLAALNAGLAATTIAAGATATVAVHSTVAAAATGGTVDNTTLVATIAAGGHTSPPATAIVADTVQTVPTLTVVANAPSGHAVTPGQPAIDVFTLTNTSSTTGIFSLTSAAVTGAGAATISAYTLTVNGRAQTFPTLAALDAALAATPVAPGAAVTVSTTYPVAANAPQGTIDHTTLTATVAIGAQTSAPASAVAPDTVQPAPTLTNVAAGPAAGQPVAAGQLATDTFSLTNTSGQSGTFSVGSAVVTGAGAGPIGAYVLTVGGHATTYPTLAALNAALATTPIAAGAAVTIGVQSTVAAGATSGAVDHTTLVATIAGAGTVSAPATAVATDIVGTAPTLVVIGKTAGAPARLAPGQPAVDAFTLTNTSAAAGTFQVPAAATVTSPAGPIAVAGYTLTAPGAPAGLLTLAQLDAALAALPVQAGRSVTVGVVFDAPATLPAGANITGVLASTITVPLASGGSLTSAPASATDISAIPGALSIVKSVNAPSAQPGDALTYSIDVTNRSASSATAVSVTDLLPRGFTLIAKTVAARTGSSVAAVVTTTVQGSTVTFDLQGALAAGAVLHLVYATTVTPDALRGTGKNVAFAAATVNGEIVRGGPATATIVLGGGVLDSCGTIVGRVFVDTRGDGRQVAGEPGVAHAAIVLDDGSRIETDDHGLFSVPCARPGWRTGTLDLRSVPGYVIAPNSRRLDRTSATTTVHLEPSGMVRMNFAVRLESSPKT